MAFDAMNSWMLVECLLNTSMTSLLYKIVCYKILVYYLAGSSGEIIKFFIWSVAQLVLIYGIVYIIMTGVIVIIVSV